MIYEILDGQTVINTISADISFMQTQYPEGNYREVLIVEPEPIVEHPKRYISVGSFYDRFGTEKWNILSSTDLMVQAMIKDVSVRKYVDLDRADLLAGLQMIKTAGFNIDPQAIVSAEIQPEERV